ncbi:CST complex subunit CTC1 isoform X3 [Cannabis sativa]|uniref:CST complex subunit CTC1 isoform X3 n=1 Tax=Cannabis sativa TaxID=3483 RepID=UPI0029CA0621|nr:CST complex subunit CTC1 isoform X3 [Cannabis sativa]
MVLMPFSEFFMEEPKLLTIAHLIHAARPLTAAFSHHSHLSSHSDQIPATSSAPPLPPKKHNSNQNPKVLTPLHYPALLIGTVTLPAVVHGVSSSSSTRCSNNNSCFQFSDGSATVCCDILDLHLSMIGSKIRVLGWNFIPFKRGGGFLEIIRWGFLDLGRGSSRSSEVESYSLVSGGCENGSKCRHRLHGVLEFISPICVVPCASSGGGNLRNTAKSETIPGLNLRGFLVQIMVCECRLCSSKSKDTISALNDSVEEQSNHSFTKPFIVYFCGQASSWHPVITKQIGNVVTISNLKKKLVYIGDQHSRLMYVTAEKSCLSISRYRRHKIHPNNKTNVEGKGECGSYTGVVRGVYMQGMVVELDNEVWLLLTNHLITPPHSLRVGALISLRNVHFVNPRFSWTKMLILGACYKTSITVKCFSPLVTGCHIISQSPSMLGNFIDSLVFSARFWVLLLISCFRKKFGGMLSEKEILGSKHKEGLVQIYANAHLPPSMLRSPQGVFMSLCKYNSCGCEGHSSDLKLVVPLATFIHHCDATWMRTVQLKKDRDKELQENNLYSLFLCEGRSYDQPIRNVFSSEDIGIVLIGSLQISPSSGRLQLVDATSSVDVIIPDLPSTWNSSSIYEVVDYILVLEGMPQLMDYLGLIGKPFSCKSVFNFISLARAVNLAVHVQFHLRSAACRNLVFYPRTELGEDMGLESGIYHLLHVTHKFPVLGKFQGDNITPDKSNIFVEAVIFHWNLFLNEKDGHATMDSGDQLKKRMKYCDGRHHDEHIFKRCKKDHISSKELSDLVDTPCKAIGKLRTCLNSSESCDKQSFCNFTSHQISCSATIKGVNNRSVVRSVILPYTGTLNGCGFCRPSAQKVLLELKPESLHIYQFLQIGCYYITKHDGEDSLCSFKDSDHVSSAKFFVTSRHRLLSLSFIPDHALPGSNLPSCSLLDSCSLCDEVSLKNCNEACLHVANGDCLETSSDVSVRVPLNMINLLDLNLREVKGGLFEPVVTSEEIAEVYACPGTVASYPPSFSNSNCLPPEGNLITLQGHVVAAHYSQHHGDSLKSKFLSGIASTSCFHVLVEHQIVKIVGSLSKHALPLGLGPGVDAIFHRVLQLGGQNRWVLTPVSFIVITSIGAVNNSCNDQCPALVPEMSCFTSMDTSFSGLASGFTSLDNLSSSLISKLVQQPDCRLMRIHCRVVSVNILVFEKYRKWVPLLSKARPLQHLVNIPIAGFFLDDGSSPCFGWANGERARSLLRLNDELPKKAHERNNWTLKGVDTDENTHHTISYHLERILENHDRITVKNFGSLYDSSYQDLVVSVSPENSLSVSDENFLKSVVLNACFGTSWTIIASMVDLDAVGQLEIEKLLLPEIRTKSMKNVWAKEVHITNPFTEARNVIQELLGSST